MANRPVPRIPGSNTVIRTYPVGDQEDWSSDESSAWSKELDDESDYSTESLTHREGNHFRASQSKHFLEVISQEDWKLQPTGEKLTDGVTDIMLVTDRVGNHQFLGSLDDLAGMLNCPSNWKEHYERLSGDECFMKRFQAFCSLPEDAKEPLVSDYFVSLVSEVSQRLNILINEEIGETIEIGGVLSLEHLNVRDTADISFSDNAGMRLLSALPMKATDFPQKNKWYQQKNCSKMASLFCALFTYNCPTVLLTPKHWKVFVENSDRTAILTYPYNEDSTLHEHVKAALTQTMGPDFIKLIVICLLSQKSRSDNVPCFLSGCDKDGQGVYTTIRVKSDISS